MVDRFQAVHYRLADLGRRHLVAACLQLALDRSDQPFDRGKLERSIAIACRKRDVPADRIDRLITSIQRQLETRGDEVTTSQIGEAVMDGLKAIDHVAYIRFASVYKDFRDPGDFAEIAGAVGDGS
jgi:transcriptional repressor NrdR